MKIKKSNMKIFILFTYIISIIVICTVINFMPRILAKPITSSISVSDIPKSNQANAYFEIFKDLCQSESESFRNGKKYLALDLSYVIYDDASNLTALFLDYCDKNGHTLLMETSEELRKKGYINQNPSFINGFLISFYDREINDDSRLVIGGSIWVGGTAAYFAQYTIELIDGEWKITDKNNIGMA